MSSILQIKGICKSYGARMILDDATAAFTRGQKIGVIGRNGAGKSTLLRIITGQEEADKGTISRSSELRLSYLEQHDPYKLDETVIDFLERYTGEEGWRCAEMAGRFQIKDDRLYMTLSQLSGGYRTRVKLTAMLIKEPNFLILDEPTNYLDLSTLILLENFLLDFKGGFLVVSHDREFLKRTCDQTLEVENGQLSLYPGGIEEYFEFKAESERHKLAHNKAVEKKREQLQEFVDRFRARASTASRAQSKLKQMQKLTTIEIGTELPTVKIRIPQVERKGGVALAAKELEVGYPDKCVASGINLEMERGERIAVLGDNGQGKTTFLRTIASDLPPRGGSWQWGTGLQVAYYAQHVFTALDAREEVVEFLTRTAARGVTTQDILNMAGCFLFTGNDVRKKVGVLSGGERARLVLAGLLLSGFHVLILDEPTNHLDFETVESLAHALKDFAGTVFFTCHDRTFVNLVATSILDVKNGRIARYPGTYEEYVDFLERMARQSNEHGEEDFQEGTPEDSAKKTAAAEQKEKELADEQKKLAKEEAVQLKKQLDKLEGRKNHYGMERDKLLKQLEENPLNFSKERNQKIKEFTCQIEDTQKDWLKLQGQYEKLLAKGKDKGAV